MIPYRHGGCSVAILHMENHEYKRVLVYPVGTDGCRLIVTEYFTWQDGQKIQTNLTLRTAPPFGRTH